MERKYLILLIIIILAVLVAFFFPKPCGYWWGARPGDVIKDCICIGIKYSPPVFGGGHITCFGIPISYSCYYYESDEVTDEVTGVRKVDIPCE